MITVRDSIIVGCPSAPYLALVFPYVHGVLRVRSGYAATRDAPILEVSFDTLETDYSKLLSLMLAFAFAKEKERFTVYNKNISNICAPASFDSAREYISTATLSEFNFDTELSPSSLDITVVLAHSNEARVFQSTEEGARRALTDTRRALLNLLEDAREAEDTVRKQAESLSDALENERALAEARANFISTASHQLRTPLTTMRWFSEMLVNGDAGELTGEAKEYMSQINQGIDRIINLVSFLLRSARIESKRVSIKPELIHIREAIDRTVARLYDTIQKKKQTVSIQCTGDPVIALDAEFLGEVLLNLISNASLYSPEVSVITVTVEGSDDDIIISIKDTGIGIKDSDRERIFDKFFRAPEAVIASPDGTGLGLAYVREIIHQWGGEISFTSTEGKETTFRFTIPKMGMTAREGDVTLSE